MVVFSPRASLFTSALLMESMSKATEVDTHLLEFMPKLRELGGELSLSLFAVTQHTTGCVVYKSLI
jgi:hypothetical protein